jgi:hypothetical protein
MGQVNSRVGSNVRQDRRPDQDREDRRKDQVECMSLKVLELHKDLIVETNLWVEGEFSPLMDNLHDAVDATSFDHDTRRRSKSIIDRVVHPASLANATRDEVEKAQEIVARHVQKL